MMLSSWMSLLTPTRSPVKCSTGCSRLGGANRRMSAIAYVKTFRKSGKVLLLLVPVAKLANALQKSVAVPRISPWTVLGVVATVGVRRRRRTRHARGEVVDVLGSGRTGLGLSAGRAASRQQDCDTDGHDAKDECGADGCSHGCAPLTGGDEIASSRRACASRIGPNIGEIADVRAAHVSMNTLHRNDPTGEHSREALDVRATSTSVHSVQ